MLPRRDGELAMERKNEESLWDIIAQRWKDAKWYKRAWLAPVLLVFIPSYLAFLGITEEAVRFLIRRGVIRPKEKDGR